MLDRGDTSRDRGASREASRWRHEPPRREIRWRQVILVPALAIAIGGGSSVLIAHLVPPPARSPELPTQAEPNLPPPRSSAAMAYDPAIGNTLLFGGEGAGRQLDDTWSWNGARWSQLHPRSSPPGLTAPEMAYDPRSGRMILVGVVSGGGGGTGSSELSTWSWDGSAWQLGAGLTFNASVRPELGADDATRQLILVTAGGSAGAATWVWSDGLWAPLHPALSPPQSGLLAFDPQSSRLLLLTGAAAKGAAPGGQLWAWNGSTWSPAAGPATRAPRDDEGRPEILSPSAHGPVLLTASAMYLWDAGRWVSQGLTPDPRRMAEAVAYDAARQEVVIFGGNCLTCLGLPLVDLDDTWTWDGRWSPGAGAIAPTPMTATRVIRAAPEYHRRGDGCVPPVSHPQVSALHVG
jgi:hypothetical protein